MIRNRILILIAMAPAIAGRATAHPIKGNDLAAFRVFHKFLECKLHGPMADFTGGGAAQLTGENLPDSVKKSIQKWLKDMFVVKPDGATIEPEIDAAYFYNAANAVDQSYEVDLKYPTKAPAKKLTITANFDPETIISVGGSNVKIHKYEPTVTIDTNANLDSLWRNVQDFTYMGMEHLFTGFDHMLFICTLIFASMNIKGVIKLLTAFTVGHAITLILTSFDVFRVNPRLVDMGIAATIVYVALENIVRKKEINNRWVVVFFFGLIHGMGFSASLREMGLPQNGLVLCLFSFNIGIEIAQVIIVLLILPFLLRMLWFKERLKGEIGKAEFRRMLNWGSATTAAFGGYWLVTRAFGIG